MPGNMASASCLCRLGHSAAEKQRGIRWAYLVHQMCVSFIGCIQEKESHWEQRFCTQTTAVTGAGGET